MWYLTWVFVMLSLIAAIMSAYRMSVPTGPYETASKTEIDTFKLVGLPLASGTKFWISQGAFGTNTHNEPGNEYHWDLDVPYGTDVIAVEDGVVFWVWEPDDDGGGCDPKYSAASFNVVNKFNYLDFIT